MPGNPHTLGAPAIDDESQGASTSASVSNWISVTCGVCHSLMVVHFHQG